MLESELELAGAMMMVEREMLFVKLWENENVPLTASQGRLPTYPYSSPSYSSLSCLALRLKILVCSIYHC